MAGQLAFKKYLKLTNPRVSKIKEKPIINDNFFHNPIIPNN
jgi:hypothetical protein